MRKLFNLVRNIKNIIQILSNIKIDKTKNEFFINAHDQNVSVSFKNLMISTPLGVFETLSRFNVSSYRMSFAGCDMYVPSEYYSDEDAVRSILTHLRKVTQAYISVNQITSLKCESYLELLIIYEEVVNSSQYMDTEEELNKFRNFILNELSIHKDKIAESNKLIEDTCNSTGKISSETSTNILNFKTTGK